MFRGRVVDIDHDNLMIEIAGQESKIEAFIELMRPTASWSWPAPDASPWCAAMRNRESIYDRDKEIPLHNAADSG